jgi:WD40 repeat protein
VASAGADQTIRLWHVESREEIARLRGHTDEIYTVAFSPDGKTLASGGRDGTVQFWDASPKERPRPFVVLREEWGTHFQFTLDGRSYVLPTDEGGINFMTQKLARSKRASVALTSGTTE